MAKKWTKNILNGAWATVKVNGQPLFECSGNTATITVSGADIQDGFDIDFKALNWAGEGNMKVYHVYSRGKAEYMKSIREGHDKRLTIENRIADPDAVGKQVEAVTITNAWLKEFPLIAWERGDVTPEEISYGFTPSDAMFNEIIEQM